MLKPGWLRRQFKKVEEDIKEWPEWMRRETGLMHIKSNSEKEKVKVLRKDIQEAKRSLKRIIRMTSPNRDGSDLLNKIFIEAKFTLNQLNGQALARTEKEGAKEKRNEH